MSGLKVQYLPQYTTADYEQWEGDWELIDGIPYAMSPSANKRHQRIAFAIAKYLDTQLTKCSCELLYELDWRIDSSNVVRPDIVIVCHEDDSDFINTVPRLIVEILSHSTAQKDQILKFSKYEKAGVAWYIIVNPDRKEIIIYQLQNGKYEEYSDKDIVLEDNCKIEFDRNKVWD